jgi:hypothetical protein
MIKTTRFIYKERNKLGALINPLDSKIKFSQDKK